MPSRQVLGRILQGYLDQTASPPYPFKASGTAANEARLIFFDFKVSSVSQR